MTTTDLLDRHVRFVRALRDAGVPVSVSEALDAAGVYEQIDLIDRASLRAAFATTLIKRQVHRPAFEALFELYFPATSGRQGSVVHADGTVTQVQEERESPRPWEVNDPFRTRLREELFEFLLRGDERLGMSIARDAVSAFAQQRGSGASTNGWTWSRSLVMDRLAPQTLFAELLRQLLRGSTDQTRETVLRSMLDDRVGEFEQMVENEVRRRIAERDGTDAAARAGRRPVDQLPLQSATAKELAEIRREIAPLARRLGARLARKQRLGSRGQLDMRHTIRASLSTGGVPATIRHKPKHPVKMDLVVLCDVSQSVSSFAHFTLLLVYALREQFTRVRTFAFVDEIDEVTEYFKPGVDVAEAIRTMGERAHVVGLTGRTDYGAALRGFERRWPDAIGSRTCLLILGDARTNYANMALPQLRQMVDRAHRAHWLNPERERSWDVGDSVAGKYGDVVPMVECRNLAQLADFVADLG